MPQKTFLIEYIISGIPKSGIIAADSKEQATIQAHRYFINAAGLTGVVDGISIQGVL